jgi:hypothetical protein
LRADRVATAAFGHPAKNREERLGNCDEPPEYDIYVLRI